MKENLEVWQKHLLKAEGGFSDRSTEADPGGWTKHGVTRAALAHHRGVNLHEVSKEDVQGLLEEEAMAIAAADYWNPPRCGDMPGGLDVYVADFSYNSGPRQAVRTLQRVLGFSGDDVDGFCGPLSLKAAAKRDPVELIDSYHDARMEFLRGLKNWQHNANGWTNRCKKMRALALSLAPEKAPAAVAKADGRWRWIATIISLVGTFVTTWLPDIIEGVQSALAPAQEAYQKTTEALEPVLGVYSTVLVPIFGGVVMVTVIFVHVRARSMARNAKSAGVVAEVVSK